MRHERLIFKFTQECELIWKFVNLKENNAFKQYILKCIFVPSFYGTEESNLNVISFWIHYKLIFHLHANVPSW